jgi:hypothetical protein
MILERNSPAGPSLLGKTLFQNYELQLQYHYLLTIHRIKIINIRTLVWGGLLLIFITSPEDSEEFMSIGVEEVKAQRGQ